MYPSIQLRVCADKKQVFGNSNSLPISLVISLSQTLKGLHWDKIPGDNDDEVAARGILYLLIFQQLGQLVRWSWGYHVLLAPASKYDDEGEETGLIEEGRYRDDPDHDDLIPGLDGGNDDFTAGHGSDTGTSSRSFESGGRTPVTNALYVQSMSSDSEDELVGPGKSSSLLATPVNGNVLTKKPSNGNLTSFPTIRSSTTREDHNIPSGIRGWIPMATLQTKRGINAVSQRLARVGRVIFHALPTSLQIVLSIVYRGLTRVGAGAWEFMNPPLWAMLIAVIVASIPSLQRLFFQDGSFIANSVTRAIGQSGGVAVPLILVVLGANLARNTLPQEALEEDSEENRIGTKLLVASLISRMLLPTLIMAPLLALIAKYVPVSIVDDPIFVIVCFLLTGAPSALQLAQICQINGVYEGVMSKLLFQSYVIWYVSRLGFIPTHCKLINFTGFYRQLSFLSCVLWRLWNGPTQSSVKRPKRSLYIMGGGEEKTVGYHAYVAEAHTFDTCHSRYIPFDQSRYGVLGSVYIHRKEY
jgi:predicted permease